MQEYRFFRQNSQICKPIYKYLRIMNYRALGPLSGMQVIVTTIENI
jgi:hypothetical protein